jgi:nucleotide-binding universal stress UspA family protein
MLERVLIPLDGSDRAESVLPLLEPLFHRRGSEVFLVRAVPPGSAPLDAAEGYLRGIADRFLETGICAHSLVGVGATHQIIESLAYDEEITLVVLSVHEDAAPGPLLERLLRDSRRPLLVLRPAPGGRLGLAPCRSILVPLDGSEASRQSLPLALELAAALDSRVILLRVLEQPSERLDALRDLRDIADRLNRQGLIAEIWVESGDPVEQILRACRDEDIQLVAMTTQGRSGTPEALLGNVTRQILNRSPLPVLALHVRG